MTPEQWVAVIGAITAAIVAFTALFVQVATLSKRVDGRLTQLLEVTREASHSRGVIDEKQTQLTTTGLPVPVVGSDRPVASE